MATKPPNASGYPPEMAVASRQMCLYVATFLGDLLDDVTPNNERARREVKVAGPGAFVVLKAHALKIRGENKDAYDLVYVLRNFGNEPVVDVVTRFCCISSAPQAVAALAILDAEFASTEHIGPRRYAEFLGNADDGDRRAEAFAAVREFLRLVRS